jgi:hypothetical protein
MKNSFYWILQLLAEKAFMDNLPSFKINWRVVKYAPRALVIKHNKSVAKFVCWTDLIYANIMIFMLILFWMASALGLHNTHNPLAQPLFLLISVMISFSISLFIYQLKKK